MKRRSISDIIREWQIKTVIPPHTYESGNNPGHRHHQMLLGRGAARTLIYLLVRMQNGAAPWKTVQRILAKLSIALPLAPATTLLGIFPNAVKT